MTKPFLRRNSGLVPKGRRRLFVFITAFVVLAVYAAIPAFAVHNTKFFQLDGDARAATQPTGVTSNGNEDWDNICKAHVGPVSNNDPGEVCHPASATSLNGVADTIAERSTFITDAFNQGSDNIFKGGTDDSSINNPPDGVSGSVWQWKQAKPSPSKADIEQAFAAQYTCTAALQAAGKCSTGSDFLDHKYVYFGGTRFANNGDTNIGLWFFHNKVTVAGAGTVTSPTGVVSCPNPNGCGFSGSHTVGNVSLGGSLGEGCNPNPDPLNN